jgi:hypothetical protein
MTPMATEQVERYCPIHFDFNFFGGSGPFVCFFAAEVRCVVQQLLVESLLWIASCSRRKFEHNYASKAQELARASTARAAAARGSGTSTGAARAQERHELLPLSLSTFTLLPLSISSTLTLPPL